MAKKDKKEKKNSETQNKPVPNVVLNLISRAKTFFALLLCALLTIVITYILYNYTQNLLQERLQERLVAIVSTAATQIDANEVDAIRTMDDLDKPEMEHLVQQLNDVRDANENILYAYLMRRTDDPNTLEFVADADSLTAQSDLDLNGDGVVEDEEGVPLPGDPYDAAEYPVLRDEAFYYPSVDRELQPDQWGIVMAAYAPILDEDGNSIAILGIDVRVDDFQEKTQATLMPFLLFIFFLLFLLTLLTLLLVRFYGERVKAMQEIDRQKDELLSMVSHQLATPVSSVKWYLEMLLDGDVGKLTDEQKEYLQTMGTVTHNLADLVSMILDVSRIQLGRIKIDRQDFDLNELLNEIFSVIDPKAKEHKVELNKILPAKLPAVRLDRRLIRMVIENLLSNAVKYTPEKGKVTMKIENKGDMLYVEVADTGRGIPKADQGKIFGKLYRASNVQSVEGNGFGLYIVKGAVEAHDGKIWFESTEGKGTKFMFEIPINKQK